MSFVEAYLSSQITIKKCFDVSINFYLIKFEKPIQSCGINVSYILRTTMFASIFIVKLKRSRTKCTILYATETGRSETFAKTLCHTFNQVFSVHVRLLKE
jgi:hypothetical protein